MKFMHLGDMHLGKSLGDFDLYEDQRFMLDQILTLIQKEGVEALLLAGDIYDRAIPPEGAVRNLDYFLRNLAAAGVQVYMISGNHDSDERLHFGSALFAARGIFIGSKYEGRLQKQVARDAFGDIHIYLLPFVKASQVRHFFPEEEIESYDDAIQAVVRHSDFDPAHRNILVAHQFVAGNRDPLLSGSESPGTQSVGLVEKISCESLAAFDYVALGHIHSPQRVGREHIRYSGSILKYSLSEVHNDKRVPIITLEEKGKLTIEEFPLTPLRDLRHIKGPLKQLLDPNHVVSAGDFIYATLTDEDMVQDVMGIFQTVYPNTVKVDYENSHTRAIENVDITKGIGPKTFEELAEEFYRQMYGSEMSAEEKEIMAWAAGKAGVADETH